MNKDVGAIIAAILLVLVIAFVASNYDLTGKATKEVITKVAVKPAVINAGEIINIEINPGNGGIHKTYYICSTEFLCHVNNEIRCGSFKCTKPLVTKYKSWNSWEGIYYIKVFDYETNEFVKTYFTMVQ